ncbi:glycoside hydrolase family 65 protein [Actinomadura livida]|uniref:Glycosyl hydrolase family 65 protein n=1 Tax=Actinomadura livida TaxID=79909 RepID=A0A7W7MVR4_9ACTN|nr:MULTISPECIES: glycoside hydrolase family 65 protein [Actinomadura]MBB4772057.1 trehalose/maltose hydrolase-like predicted phosphorylase [Actinomadura catellatispora]GGU04405.1 family 65 glycosyl hydrolase [Actinomadura livida]
MDRWILSYDHYEPGTERLREALCTLGNGYFATRGAAPEASAGTVHYPGTYIAGCYDRLPAEIDGRHIDNTDLVTMPNWLPLAFRAADGEWLDLDRAQADDRLLSYQQELDMRRGVLTRLLRVRDAQGRTSRIAQRRIVSMDDPHLAALETTIVAEDWSGPAQIISALDGRVANAGVERYRRLPGAHLTHEKTSRQDDPELLLLRTRTISSQIGIAVAARTRISAEADQTTRCEDAWTGHDLTLDVREGEPVTVEKVAAVFTSRDHAVEESGQAALAAATDAGGFDDLLERHTLAWSRIWRRCQLSVDDVEVQRALNLHIFHLMQTVSEHSVDLDVGVPARGLHGEAYRGHVFWDELFILPFLTMRFPEIARALLMYRWRRLPAARRAAAAAGHRGAMYPWQSAADGREETQRVHLNPRSGRWLPDHTHLQRHVGLTVALNVWRYYEATGDAEFLAEHGTEIMLEVARFFADLAAYDRSTDRYEIRGVMGPDEYHDAYPGRERPGLDNNAYTNVLAAWVLRRALDAFAALPRDRRAELHERLTLTRQDITRFEDVARKMYVPFHDGVISQFDGYADLEEFDWTGYRERYGDIRRLDRILEAEGDSPNRYKVSKQADVLMLFYVLSPGELDDVLRPLGYEHGPALAARTIAYYLPRTCDGSTLSSLVHAWILARVDGDTAWKLFLESLFGDINDVQHGTTGEGVHLGAMAGTVDLVQRCHAGISTRGGILRLEPRLPAAIGELRLGLRYRGHWGVDLTCRHDLVRVVLRPGAASPIRVSCGTEEAEIQPGASWETPIPDG